MIGHAYSYNLTCRHCGARIRRYKDKIYVDSGLVFAQYCGNTMDGAGNVIKWGGLHEPMEEKKNEGEERMKNKPLTRIEFKKGDFKHYPTVDAVSNWQFEGNQTGEEEAELASCVAKVGTANGLSAGDIQHAFPLILRMLKSKSVWTE